MATGEESSNMTLCTMLLSITTRLGIVSRMHPLKDVVYRGLCFIGHTNNRAVVVVYNTLQTIYSK